MKRNIILMEKEAKANREMACVFLLIDVMVLIACILEMLNVFILPKAITMIALVATGIVALVPCIIIFVLKINARWVKYMVIVTVSIIVCCTYSIFTFHVTIALSVPLLIASVYNYKKILVVTYVCNTSVVLIGHILAPFYTINVNEPFQTLEESLLYGFIPRALMLFAIFIISYCNVRRFNEAINSVLEYGEDLEKSTNGLKRVFIESQDMLMAESSEGFLQSVGGALFRVIKFLNGTRENIKCLIVIKNEKEEFIAIDEVYSRQDDKVSFDNRFLHVSFEGKELKIVRTNYQNEGNCVTCDNSIIMTFYEKDKLVGLIVVDAIVDMLINSNNLIMNVLYNAIKLCISTKQAEKIMKESQEKLIYAFSVISESKSKETGLHIRRVSEYMRVIGKSICKTYEECNNLACAAMLHDIGKLIIPSAVLNKSGKLTEQEYNMIREHTKYGGDLLKDVPGEMMSMARNIAMYHHERWDGEGYNKIKGEEINFYARYVSVIDVFDALISERCYKPEWSFNDAYNEIVSKSGTQFAPDAVELFKEKFDELVEVYKAYPDK